LIDSVPYTYLPKLPAIPLPFDGNEEYILRVRHLNNTYSTYIATKFLQLNFLNAFLSSNFVDLYALGTFKTTDVSGSTADKRYFSQLQIELKVWDQREIKVFLLTILYICVIGVALFLVVFALIGMRQQEKENDKRSTQELARLQTMTLLAKIAQQVGKIGREELEKEE
jgi:dolichyl-phosphate-mannose--protein O-mannosyl transferase